MIFVIFLSSSPFGCLGEYIENIQLSYSDGTDWKFKALVVNKRNAAMSLHSLLTWMFAYFLLHTSQSYTIFPIQMISWMIPIVLLATGDFFVWFLTHIQSADLNQIFKIAFLNMVVNVQCSVCTNQSKWDLLRQLLI